MLLFLIRHGETVDNVAGVYAGSRDSALTSHGVLQAGRLAAHMAEQTPLKHIFSSNLQRAAKTAEAIALEQRRVHLADVPVVQLAHLREKDFGSDEGVRFGSRGRAEDRRTASDAETAEALWARVEGFLDEHLLPLLSAESGAPSAGCAIVAHGIILGVLYRSLCSRVGRGGITVDPSPSVAASLVAPPVWDNTAYLECAVSIPAAAADGDKALSLKLHVKQVNCLSHLRDLKKTRGGTGSSAYDDKQRTLTSFFSASPNTLRSGRSAGE